MAISLKGGYKFITIQGGWVAINLHDSISGRMGCKYIYVAHELDVSFSFRNLENQDVS